MVLKTEICRFSGLRIYPGHGCRFVRGDGQVFVFLSSKTKHYFHNKLKPSKLAWTALYRRQHKKGTTEEVARKKRRTTSKAIGRSIGSTPLEVIVKKRSEKTEVRAAARDAALREIKERVKKAKDDKKSKKAEFAGKKAAAAKPVTKAAPAAAKPKGGKR
eukprot:jgi/Mesvir1/6876/Mv09044-RA.1